ncbi:lamin tail domain-containing protein [Corallococcus sp. bb12-1]|uniref:lamin tail domain-containing protein n=1 Tax=Corallococcus sp. bb12-1 TaxID=2996784 RepID=UPI00226F5061|nr:lamin tail domain-containing protein [Corallococcus sp. bb12-1]MCY1040093.1 lamin tail domain-containing protein [Corallococcus sp. bb12-1]
MSRSIRAVWSLVLLTTVVSLSACSSEDPETAGPVLPAVTLHAATVGAPFEQVLTATGGTPPLTYSVSTLPPGFSFYGDSGRLVGPATEEGEWTLTVGVRDAKGAQQTRSYALRAWAAPVISTVSPLPPATAGIDHTFTFTATGGAPPLTWSQAGGALPPGLELSPAGVLTGTPQNPALYEFTLQVTDANGVQATAVLRLPLRTPNGDLPDGGPVTDAGTATDGGTKTDGGTDAGPATSAPLKVGNWNIEWFGDPGYGPTDEALQLANATAVIADAGPDVLGVAEIVNDTQFNALKAGLPGYDGFLAGDSTRVGGAYYYYGAADQKVGVLFKSDVVQVLAANVVLSSCISDFAGRPPLRVDLRVTRGSVKVDLTVMVLHMKAFADADAYARRQGASACLKDYLDTTLPTQNVMVMGDWNDDVDTSIYVTNPSPYQNLVSDPARYKFLTQALSESGARSTVGNSQFIDHQLVTNELVPYHVADSTAVLRPSIANYGNSTSDHYPIFSRFDFGTLAQPRSVKVTAPNGGETLAAGSTFDITWTSSNVSQVNVQYSLDGTVWRDVATNLSAASGRYTWTVPSEASTTARVRVADATRADVADLSDGAFTLTRPTLTVFINEYLAQPVNGPAGTPDYDQQFVELYNAGPGSVDLSGWKIHDAKSYSGTDAARHTFAAGTVLPAGKGYVVYSGATALPQGATYATVSNGGQGLRFDRGVNQQGAGDTVYLVRADGTVQDSHSYASPPMDVYQGYSFNRKPDRSATGSWGLCSELGPYVATPGRRADGSAF